MAKRRKVRDVLAEVLTAFVKERFGQDFSVDPMDIHPVRGSWRNGRGADYSPTSWNAFAKDSSFTTRMVAGVNHRRPEGRRFWHRPSAASETSRSSVSAS